MGKRASSDWLCAKCGCQKAYTIEEAKIPNYEFSNSFEALTLTGHYGETGETGMLGGAKKARMVVRLEATVCSECGYTELFAKDLNVLSAMAKVPGSGVR